MEDHALCIGREHGGENRRSQDDRRPRGAADDAAPRASRRRSRASSASAVRAVPPAASSPRPGPQPRSASCGMPIGATSTLPASAAPRLVSSPVFGRWKVTVRSARTTGVARVAGGQVDRRSACRPRRSAPSPCARPGSARPRTGSGRAARPGRRSRAAHRRRSTPRSMSFAEHPELAARSTRTIRATRGSRSSRSQFRTASARRWLAAARDEHDRDTPHRRSRGSAPRRTRRRRCCRDRRGSGSGPCFHRSVASAMALTAAATATPACSMSRCPGTPSFCARRSAPVIASDADRGPRRRVRPA